MSEEIGKKTSLTIYTSTDGHAVALPIPVDITRNFIRLSQDYE